MVTKEIERVVSSILGDAHVGLEVIEEREEGHGRHGRIR